MNSLLNNIAAINSPIKHEQIKRIYWNLQTNNDIL